MSEHTDTTPNAPMTKSQLREQNEILAGQVERYRIAFDPRRWNREMSEAWHLNTPDVQKAFEALADVVRQEDK